MSNSYEFVLTGTRSLLLHRDDIDGADLLESWRKDPKNKGVSKAGDDRSPGWTWQTYVYVDEDRNIVMPSDNVMAALYGAGSQLSGGKGGKTLKRGAASGLIIPDEYLELLIDGKVVNMNQFYKAKDEPFDMQRSMASKVGMELWPKRAKIGNAKHVRVRPKVRNWTVRGTIETNAPEFTASVMQDMFDIAGRKMGLCDWRPSSPKSPGPFGQFTAEVKKAK